MNQEELVQKQAEVTSKIKDIQGFGGSARGTDHVIVYWMKNKDPLNIGYDKAAEELSDDLSSGIVVIRKFDQEIVSY